MTDEKAIRTFLALDTPEGMVGEIARVQERLKRLIRGDIGWVRPEAIHLTLKFFGEISPGDVAGISAAAGKVAAAFGPFDLLIGGAGVFPDPKRPRVIWLGVKGETARLAAFHKELERSLGAIGFPGEGRPFKPHLTLGRIRSRELTGLAEVLEKRETYTAGDHRSSGLVLYQSDLTPRGAIYTRLAAYPFAGTGSEA